MASCREALTGPEAVAGFDAEAGPKEGEPEAEGPDETGAVLPDAPGARGK